MNSFRPGRNRHNSMTGGSNAAVQTGDEGGVATEDMVIDCNFLDGGGYTLNIRGTGTTVPKGTVHHQQPLRAPRGVRHVDTR